LGKKLPAAIPRVKKPVRECCRLHRNGLIATRVQSNVAGVKGEVITYDCRFGSLDPARGEPGKSLG
jgi:hypothetical protein